MQLNYVFVSVQQDLPNTTHTKKGRLDKEVWKAIGQIRGWL